MTDGPTEPGQSPDGQRRGAAGSDAPETSTTADTRDTMTDENESTEETEAQHDDQTVDTTDASTLSRRAALASLGLAGLFGLGTGTASADPQGQVGTASDPLQALYTDELYAGDAGTITLGDVLDLKGNDISLSDSFDFHINAGSWPYVAFTDTNSQSEVRIDWDQDLFSLHRTDFQIRDGGVVKDDTGATHLTINSDGPLGVNQTLDLAGNALMDSTGDLTIAGSAGNGVTITTDEGTPALSLGVPTSDGTDTAGSNVVAGHQNNIVNDDAVGVTVSGGGAANGNEHAVGGDYATVGGGKDNTANGTAATVPGGDSNTASGDHSFAAGQFAEAADSNAFVWNDGSGGSASTGGDSNAAGGGTSAGSDSTPFSSSTAVTDESGEPVGSNTATIKASDGVRFVTSDTQVGGNFASTEYDPEFAWISRSGDVRTSGGVDADGSVNAGKEVVADDFVFGPKLYTTDIAPGSGTADVGVDSNGQLVDISSSSARYKTNVEPLETGGSGVLDLEPKSFEYDETGEPDIGFLAEEVDDAVPDLVLYDDEGRPDGVKYHRLGVYLLPEIGRNRERLTDHEDKLDDATNQIDDIREENDWLRERIADLEAENEQLRERLEAVEERLGMDATAGQQEVADD